MSTVLSYFDFDGSRGLECRIALTVAGVSFEDRRLNRDQWASRKPTTPFGGMPVLDHDGGTLAQTNAILRFVGVSSDLHPTEPWAGALHDALMQSVEDLRHKVPGKGLSEEEKKDAREAFAAGWLTRWATTVNESIAGPFVAGPKMNVVDLKLYVMLRAILAGTYDHVPLAMFDAFPALTALVAAVDSHPAVAAYWAAR
jgi:glutathione S-transferase